MNLRNLYHIYTTSPASITALAERHGLDPGTSMGVVQLLIANDGNLGSLSPKQKQHYELSIEPLIAQ